MARFHGKLEVKMSLLDVIQFISIAGKEGKLLVRSEDSQGTVYFKNGQMIHAESGTGKGEESFYEIALWSGGDFLFAEVPVSCPASIEQGLPSLLLEAARRQDEQGIVQSVSGVAGSPAEPTPLQVAYKKLMAEEEEVQSHAQTSTAKPRKLGYLFLLVLLLLTLAGLIYLVFFHE